MNVIFFIVMFETFSLSLYSAYVDIYNINKTDLHFKKFDMAMY